MKHSLAAVVTYMLYIKVVNEIHIYVHYYVMMSIMLR